MKALRTVKDKFTMDLRALNENLIALKETVNSIVINEDKNVSDFELSVERFQVLLEDLIVVSKAQTNPDPEILKSKLYQLQVTLEELNNFCGHKLNILSFLDDITPIN